MPQMKSLEIMPLDYEPPRRAAQYYEESIARLMCNQAYYQANIEVFDRLIAQRTQYERDHRANSDLGISAQYSDETRWLPTDHPYEMAAWTYYTVYNGGPSDGSQHGVMRYFAGQIDSSRRNVVSNLTSFAANIRNYQAELALAKKEPPAPIQISRDALRKELKSHAQIPTRSINLSVIAGTPTLTWSYDNVFCKPNEVDDRHKLYGINAGDIPAFKLPNMRGSLPLTRHGIPRFKLVRGARGVRAYSSNAVHPHQMNGRNFCLGDYQSTIEELKFQHDFAGVILLLLDFVSKCEPSDPAGSTYLSFIADAIGEQLGMSDHYNMVNINHVWEAAHSSYDDFRNVDFKKTALKVSFPRRLATENNDGPISFWGRLARLRGSWVLLPTVQANTVRASDNMWVIDQPWSYERVCELRDGLLIDSQKALFPKDLDEYNLMARMVTDNVPIMYNESTSLVLNAIDEDLSEDEDDWDDTRALVTEFSDPETPEPEAAQTDDEDEDEDEREPEEDPYVDEPF